MENGMLYEQYKLFVRERAGLQTDQAAQQAVRCVFEVLDMMLTVEEAQALAATVPLEIRDHLGNNRWQHHFDLIQFRERVAAKEGCDPKTAEDHAAAVLSVLAEYLPSPALLKSLDGLPLEVRRLFNWMKKGALAGWMRKPAPGSGNGL
jgi:uncharacterized protein (DUF2267 family)